MASKVGFSRGEGTLVSLATDSLSSLGFVHLRDLLFGRRVSPGTLQRIAFGARHGKLGEFCFSFGVGVRFDGPEALLPPGDDPFSVTISAPLSVLDTASAGFPQWCFDGTCEPAVAVKEAVASVVRHGMPFLEKYSDLEAVKRNLLSDDGGWFTFTPEQRIATLAAIEYFEGRTEAAIERLLAALEERRDMLPSKRKTLQQVLSRLEAKAS